MLRSLVASTGSCEIDIYNPITVSTSTLDLLWVTHRLSAVIGSYSRYETKYMSSNGTFSFGSSNNAAAAPVEAETSSPGMASEANRKIFVVAETGGFYDWQQRQSNW